MGEAYAHMMGVTNALLKRRGCDGVTPSAARNPAEPGLPSEVLGRAFVLACDAEADSRWTVAAAEHKTRLSVAMLVEGTDSTVTASAWFDYCGFVLRARGDAAGRTAFGPNRRATRVLALEGFAKYDNCEITSVCHVWPIQAWTKHGTHFTNVLLWRRPLSTGPLQNASRAVSSSNRVAS